MADNNVVVIAREAARGDVRDGNSRRYNLTLQSMARRKGKEWAKAFKDAYVAEWESLTFGSTKN